MRGPNSSLIINSRDTVVNIYRGAPGSAEGLANPPTAAPPRTLKQATAAVAEDAGPFEGATGELIADYAAAPDEPN